MSTSGTKNRRKANPKAAKAKARPEARAAMLPEAGRDIGSETVPDADGGKLQGEANRPAARAREAYHHGDLRRALVKAARDLLRRGGPGAVTLREAARIAGVSHNAPYRHFPSREGLLAAIAAAGFADLRDALEAAADRAPAPERRLSALGQAYLRFAVEHRTDFMLMFGGTIRRGKHPELEQTAASAFDVLRRTVASGGKSEPVEPRTLRAWGMAHGLAHLVADGQLSLETALAALGN
jgi:AcrR family transcriptional regulator